MSARVTYPTEFLKLEGDAKRIAQYIRRINDPGTDEQTVKELSFRVGVRLLRMQSEITHIGEFIDLVTEDAQ